MGPESETTIAPANLAMARTNFETARDRFALEYARGQNMLAPIVGWITRRPDRAREEATELRASILQLAEYEGRASVVSWDIPGFRAEVALGAARTHQDLQDDVVIAATEAVQTPGLWTAASRIWSGPEGDYWLKVPIAAALVGAHYMGLGYGEWRDVIAYGAIAATAITTMDIGTRAILASTTRYTGDLTGRLAELIRRKSSNDEGIITGSVAYPDYTENPSQAIGGELEDRGEDALVQALYANDIQRPPLTRYDEPWTSRLREVIGNALRPFDQTEELIRSRDISARSRLARTALALAVAAGVTGHYFLTRQPTPEVYAGNCPVVYFPDNNQHTAQSIGLDKVAHFSGIAGDVFFINAFGVPYDHSDNHAKLLRGLINQDPEGNKRIISRIARQLRETNPSLELVDTGTFKLVRPDGSRTKMSGICNRAELQSLYRSVVEALDTERP